MAVDVLHAEGAARPGLARTILYDARVRGIILQVLMILCVAAFVAWIFSNTVRNLERMHMTAGFGFLWERAGFDISQTLIPYSVDSTYFRAFLVGLTNTLLVAVVGIFFTSILGFLLGIARLSRNWLLSRLATVYIEVLRNVPLLLQLVFWYKAVLIFLPSPRAGFEGPGGTFLNNRGLYFPALVAEPGFGLTGAAFLVAIVLAIGVSYWAKQRQAATGERFPALATGIGLIILLPLIVFLLSGRPMTLEYPELAGFNFRGGINVTPEIAALLLGLILYTAAFIAEIVRAGILAVSRGQTEAGQALGFRPGIILRLIVIPQAMRVIVPPLTSQYLNLTKNSSLAVAIGYPDLVGVFKNTVLNQTGHAIEVIFITMLVYLLLSLLTSLFMNWFNARIALRER